MSKKDIDSIIKDIFEKSSDFFEKEAEQSKQNVWNRAFPDQKIEKQKKLPIFWAAAVAFLLLLSTGLSVSLFNTRKSLSALELAYQQKVDSQINENLIADNKEIEIKHDTLYIERFIEKTIEKPTIVKLHETKTDTLYIDRIVYVDRDLDPVLFATNEHSEMENLDKPAHENIEKEILISRTEKTAHSHSEKEKKFSIQFGNRSNKNSYQDKSPALFTIAKSF